MLLLFLVLFALVIGFLLGSAFPNALAKAKLEAMAANTETRKLETKIRSDLSGIGLSNTAQAAKKV